MDMPTLMVLTFALLVLYVVLRSISHDGVILRKGKNFSVAEKKKILTVLDKMEIYYKGQNKSICQHLGMCDNIAYGIKDTSLYYKIRDLYHNPTYYKKEGLQTNINVIRDGYWWNPIDLYSRYRATLILKNAIIND